MKKYLNPRDWAAFTLISMRIMRDVYDWLRLRTSRIILIALSAFLVTIAPTWPQNFSRFLFAPQVLAQTSNHQQTQAVSGSFIDYFAQEREIKAHQGSVNSASFSPDGKLIVTAGADNTVRVWDFAGKQVAELIGHQGNVKSANFSPDGKLIVTASFDGTARIWDISGKQLAELKGHQGNVYSANFSPDGKQIVTAGADKTVRLWDLSGKQLKEFKAHESSVYSVNFSPDGKRIVTASADKTARVWDVSGKLLAELKGHQDTVWSASFSPDGQSIVTASDDKTGCVWDILGKQLTELRGHQNSVLNATFSPDGQQIVTVSVDFTALIWESSGKLVGKLQQHTGGVNSASFSADGKWIVTAANDGTARLWDTQNIILTELRGHQKELRSASFSPDGKLIVTSAEDGTARVWNIANKKLVAVLKENNYTVTAASFSPNGKLILTCSPGSIHIWDISGNLLTEIIDYENLIQSPRFSSDGRLIIATGDDGYHVWETSGKLVTKINGYSLSLDGQRFVSFTSKTVNIWDLSGNLLTEIKYPGASSVAFSPDGKQIVTVSKDNIARIWDVYGNFITELTGPQDYTNIPIFSPDGKHIVATASDENTRVWDSSGNLLATFKGSLFPDGINFSPDGKRLFAPFGKSVRVWDLSGNVLAELTGFQGKITSANFSADGQQLVAASDDYTARVWYLTENMSPQFKLPDTPFSNYIDPDSRLKNRITEAYISFSPDGQRVIVYSDYGIARVWDISGKLLAKLRGVTDGVNFSSDGQKILTTYRNRNSRIWDIYGNLLAELEGGNTAKFSVDGKRIVTTSYRNGFVSLWDISGKLVAELKGQEANFSVDGKRIVTTSVDDIARVWDINGKLITELKGHEAIVTKASFSPNGQEIVTISEDKTARLWNIYGKQLVLLTGHQNELTSAIFSPNGKQIITMFNDKNYTSTEGNTYTAILWNIDGKLRKEFKQLKELWGAGDSASFSPDGQRILTVSNNDTVNIWDLSGKKLVELTGFDRKHFVNSAGKAFIKSASFSPDGKLIVAAFNGNTVRVWNSNGKLVAELKGGLNNNARFSPDGKKIVTISQDTTARVWDLSGKLTSVLQEGTEVQVKSANFSPDGQMVVAVMENNTPRLWDVSGKFRAELQGHEFWVGSATFSPDSKLIVTTSGEDARIWDTYGKQLAILQGHQGSVIAASFSPDGKRIIAQTDDNTAYIWETSGKLIGKTNENLETFNPDEKLIIAESKNDNDGNTRILNSSGKLIAELRGHQGKINTAYLSRDGKLIVTGSEDGTARVWDTNGKQLAILSSPNPPSSPKAEADRLRDRQFYAPNCAQALDPWQKALKIYQEISDNENQAVILEQLGNAHYCLSDYTKAIESYNDALAIAKQFNYPQRQVNNLANLGNVYNSLADYETATKYYNDALKILEQYQDTQLKAEVLQSRGNIYIAQGKYNEAIQDLSQALAIDNNASSVAKTKVNLAIVYYSLGDYNKAIQYYKEAAEFTPSEALGGLGNVYLALGDTTKAIEFHSSSLAKAQQNEDKEAEGNALNNLANALRQAGKLPEAEKHLRDAIAIWENLRIQLDDANKISIFEKQARTYRLLQEVLIAQNKMAEALEISERGRARAFIDLLNKRLSPNQTEQSKVTALNIEQIKQIAKHENATLVQYSIITDEFKVDGKPQTQDSKLYIWVIKPTGEVTFHRSDLKPLWQQDKLTLKQLVDKTRLSMGVIDIKTRDAGGIKISAAEGANQPKRLQRLHDLLIKPIADILPRNPNDRVIFIPQGELFLVPFPALQYEPDKYLIEKHTILTAPSIQVLDFTSQQKRRVETLNAKSLIVGNPTMPKVELEPGKPPKQLNNLPWAEKEAKDIASILKTQALTGNEASKTAILQKISQAGIIHFATHSLLDDNRGLGSAIALAPSGKDNGLLTAEEILNLNLSADLVVLSACDTGRGRITGDGVIGLSRSLISAGVPSVIVSLWAVDDNSTSFLMTEFYKNLQQKLDKATALHKAMLTTMQKYSQPINWAAFTLIGEAE
ncbi:WD-40 repeat-containing protein [Calothrix sp. NIES-2100]|uniref:CHAT domain-containing protein n=1 Tax=Calothrix sp. NIES-2100 TaxID=1954172 RepID=UPI000B6227D7|nr:WD-40 repeat-containing protein [Calothrix sp. NIES-2100]